MLYAKLFEKAFKICLAFESLQVSSKFVFVLIWGFKKMTKSGKKLCGGSVVFNSGSLHYIKELIQFVLFINIAN